MELSQAQITCPRFVPFLYKVFSVQLSWFGVNVKQFFLSSFLNKKLQLLVKNSLTESLRSGSDAVLFMCRILLKKVDFGATSDSDGAPCVDRLTVRRQSLTDSVCRT